MCTSVCVCVCTYVHTRKRASYEHSSRRRQSRAAIVNTLYGDAYCKCTVPSYITWLPFMYECECVCVCVYVRSSPSHTALLLSVHDGYGCSGGARFCGALDIIVSCDFIFCSSNSFDI